MCGSMMCDSGLWGVLGGACPCGANVCRETNLAAGKPTNEGCVKDAELMYRRQQTTTSWADTLSAKFDTAGCTPDSANNST